MVTFRNATGEREREKPIHISLGDSTIPPTVAFFPLSPSSSSSSVLSPSLSPIYFKVT